MKNTKKLVIISLIGILGYFYSPVLIAQDGEDPEIESENSTPPAAQVTPTQNQAVISTAGATAQPSASSTQTTVISTAAAATTNSGDPDIEDEAKPATPVVPPTTIPATKPAVTASTPASPVVAQIKRPVATQAILDPLRLGQLKQSQAKIAKSRSAKSKDGKVEKPQSLKDWAAHSVLLRSKKPAAIKKAALTKQVFSSKGKEKLVRERFVAGRTGTPIKAPVKKAAASTPIKAATKKFAQAPKKPSTPKKPKKPKTPKSPAQPSTTTQPATQQKVAEAPAAKPAEALVTTQVTEKPAVATQVAEKPAEASAATEADPEISPE